MSISLASPGMPLTQIWSPAWASRMSSSMARVAMSTIMGRSISVTGAGIWYGIPDEQPLRRSRSSDGGPPRWPCCPGIPPMDRSSDDMDMVGTGGICVNGRPRYLDVMLDTRSSCRSAGGRHHSETYSTETHGE